MNGWLDSFYVFISGAALLLAALGLWFAAIMPGLWLQYLTTRPPEDEMVEVAIESLKAVLPEEEILAGSGNYLAQAAEEQSREDQPVAAASLTD